MNWTAVLISVGLSLLVGVACFFWGRKSQRTRLDEERKKMMINIRRAEATASKRIQEELRELDIARDKFDKLPWEQRLELLGLKE